MGIKQSNFALAPSSNLPSQIFQVTRMTPLLFIGAAIALAIIYTLKEAFFKPGISSIPGPFIAKFTSCATCSPLA